MLAIDPAKLRSTSIYQIFPRNYTEEGTLDAAAERLFEPKELDFDYVYLTPVHPIGTERRKGSLGSPYAIFDYRAVDPDLGGESAFRRFLDAAHGQGLGVIMDVVYNHTSPDSVLATAHPDWFWKGGDGKPGPRVADWSDVADLDYSHRDLWDYQIETLEGWARFGVDGFRCDVASLVPVDFWIEARRRLAAVKPLLWIAESVHKEFVVELRRRGLYAASDPELHAAFDLSYDYDGRQELEDAWAGRRSLERYFSMVGIQEALYPERAVKLRFLENHDQPRAAGRFGGGARLRNWTVCAMLLPGAFLAYMGEELALSERIGLFDRQPMDRGAGSPDFRAFFARAHALTKRLRAEAPRFDARLVVEGLVLVARSAPGGDPRYAALLNLDGRSGRFDALDILGPEGSPLAGTRMGGTDLLSGERIELGAGLPIPAEPVIFRS
jgi:glycosidase